MPRSQADSQKPQLLKQSGEIGAFASRPPHNTVFNLDASGPVRRGHFSAREIFAVGETHSRWAHAASTKTAVSNRIFPQERDHETGE